MSSNGTVHPHWSLPRTKPLQPPRHQPSAPAYARRPSHGQETGTREYEGRSERAHSPYGDREKERERERHTERDREGERYRTARTRTPSPRGRYDATENHRAAERARATSTPPASPGQARFGGRNGGAGGGWPSRRLAEPSDSVSHASGTRSRASSLHGASTPVSRSSDVALAVSGHADPLQARFEHPPDGPAYEKELGEISPDFVPALPIAPTVQPQSQALSPSVVRATTPPTRDRRRSTAPRSPVPDAPLHGLGHAPVTASEVHDLREASDAPTAPSLLVQATSLDVDVEAAPTAGVNSPAIVTAADGSPSMTKQANDIEAHSETASKAEGHPPSLNSLGESKIMNPGGHPSTPPEETAVLPETTPALAKSSLQVQGESPAAKPAEDSPTHDATQMSTPSADIPIPGTSPQATAIDVHIPNPLDPETIRRLRDVPESKASREESTKDVVADISAHTPEASSQFDMRDTRPRAIDAKMPLKDKSPTQTATLIATVNNDVLAEMATSKSDGLLLAAASTAIDTSAEGLQSPKQSSKDTSEDRRQGMFDSPAQSPDQTLTLPPTVERDQLAITKASQDLSMDLPDSAMVQTPTADLPQIHIEEPIKLDNDDLVEIILARNAAMHDEPVSRLLDPPVLTEKLALEFAMTEGEMTQTLRDIITGDELARRKAYRSKVIRLRREYSHLEKDWEQSRIELERENEKYKADIILPSELLDGPAAAALSAAFAGDLRMTTGPRVRATRTATANLQHQGALGVADGDEAGLERALLLISQADQADPTARALRTEAVVPNMTLDGEEKLRLVYDDETELVEDPSSFYDNMEVREGLWTVEEDIEFRRLFAQQPKQFGHTAKGLPGRSVGACVEHYYMTKKIRGYKELTVAAKTGPRRLRGKESALSRDLNRRKKEDPAKKGPKVPAPETPAAEATPKPRRPALGDPTPSDRSLASVKRGKVSGETDEVPESTPDKAAKKPVKRKAASEKVVRADAADRPAPNGDATTAVTPAPKRRRKPTAPEIGPDGTPLPAKSRARKPAEGSKAAKDTKTASMPPVSELAEARTSLCLSVSLVAAFVRSAPSRRSQPARRTDAWIFSFGRRQIPSVRTVPDRRATSPAA